MTEKADHIRLFPALWRRLPRAVPDRLLAALVFVCSLLLAVGYLVTLDYKPNYKPHWFGAAAMIASGQGFVNPAIGQIDPLNKFLNHETASWDPRTLPSPAPHSKPDFWQCAHANLIYAVAFCWWLFGVSWGALIPLHALFFAVTVTLAYGVFRLGMNRPIAVAAAACYMLSPAHLQLLAELRDYSKAPFILGTVLVLGCLVRKPRKARQVVLLAAALGLLVGIGVGFRLDMMICLLPALFTLAFLLPGPFLRGLPLRLSAIGVLLACFATAGYPAIKTMREFGSTSSHNIVGGLYWRFDDEFGLRNSYYRGLQLWNDQYIHETVTSYDMRVNGAERQARYQSPESFQAGREFLRDYARIFPADLLIRAYASTLRVLEEAPAWLHWAYGANPFVERVTTLLAPLLVHLCDYGRYYALLALLLVSMRSFRIAFFCTAVLFYFGGYPALQFLPRHYFHLGFLSFWPLGFLVSQILTGLALLLRHDVRHRVWNLLRQPKHWWGPPLKRAIALACLIAAGVLIPLYAARLYQDAKVLAYTRAIQAAPAQLVETTRLEAEANDNIVLFQPQVSLAPPADADPPNARTEYLMVALNGEGDRVAVRTPYRAANPASDFSTEYIVDVHTGPLGEPTRVFFPIYTAPKGASSPARSFLGVAMLKQHAHHFQGLYRVTDSSPFPVLPNLLLTPDWETQARHKKLILSRRAYPPILRRVLSRTRNLLPNGSFEDWPEGAAAPRYYEGPTRCSALSPETRFVAEGRLAMRQTWTQPDGTDSILNKFSVGLRLQPNRRYELYVAAKNESGDPVSISALRLTETSAGLQAERVALYLITVRPNSPFAEYSGIFSTSEDPNAAYVITPTYNGETVPASVIWDDWRLLELPPE